VPVTASQRIEEAMRWTDNSKGTDANGQPGY